AAIDSEPRWLDMRWARDVDRLDLRHAAFRDAIADIAAPIHGVAKDNLASEDLRQQRRLRRATITALALVATLAVSSTVGAIIAVNERGRAVTQRARAEEAQAVAEEAQAVAERAQAVAEEERANAELAARSATAQSLAAQAAVL